MRAQGRAFEDDVRRIWNKGTRKLYEWMELGRAYIDYIHVNELTSVRLCVGAV